MQHNAPPVRPHPMLEQINALPSPQRQLAFVNRDGQLRLRQRRPYVRSHIVRSLGSMSVEARIFGNKATEEIGQIRHHVGIGVFLNHQRRRSVLAKDRQQSALYFVPAQPRLDLTSEIIQALTARRDVKLVGELVHVPTV